MKKFLRKIVFIIAPFVLLIIFMPIKKRLLYQGLDKDCSNRSIWIYDRIFNNEKPADIVFLGSSQTINGVDDKFIEKKIDKLQLKVVNFGYCRYGSNLNYVLLKEIVKTKKITTLMVEVREDEDRYSHPISPYIAENKDVLFANLLFNKNYFSDCYKHFYYKLEVIHDLIFDNTENLQIKTDDYGNASIPDTTSPEFLKKIKETRSISKQELTLVERNFHMKFSRSYIKKVNDICIQQHIKLYFIYIPVYGTDSKKPGEYETFIQYGKVLIPPEKIFENTSNWSDENHLNQSGSRQLSCWIANEIIKENK